MEHLDTAPDCDIPGQRCLREFTPGDDFHERLIEALRDPSDGQSQLVIARLVPPFANHIDNLRVLDGALAAAREGV